MDNPLVAYDQVYRAAAGTMPATGGTSRALFIGPPDNTADTVSFGGQLKFARQTRLGADIALGRWTQNAQLYPYTIFSLGVTGTGANASDPAIAAVPVARRQDPHTAATLLVLVPPDRRVGPAGQVPPLRFRQPDGGHSARRQLLRVAGPSVEQHQPHHTNRWGTSRRAPTRTQTTASTPRPRYDVGIGDVRRRLSVTARSIAPTAKPRPRTETGYTLSAVLRANELVHLRASFDDASRTADGEELTGQDRLPADLAERDAQRFGLERRVHADRQGQLHPGVGAHRRRLQEPGRSGRRGRHRIRADRDLVRLVDRRGRLTRRTSASS